MSPSRQLPVYLFALPLGQELPGQGPSLTTSLRPGLCKSRDRMSKYVRVRVRTRARACVTHCLPQARQREGSSAPGQPQGQRLRRLHPQPHCQPDTQQGLGERLLPLPESSSCRIMPSGYGHWHWGAHRAGLESGSACTCYVTSRWQLYLSELRFSDCTRGGDGAFLGQA